jgi:putative DNA primase/helicase
MPEKEWDALAVRVIKQEFDRHQHLKKPPRVTTRVLADVRLAVTSIAMLPSADTSPAWIDTGATQYYAAADLLSCRNGLVNLQKLAGGSPDFLLAPTPRFFVQNALAYDFDAIAQKPSVWLSFAHELWPDDPASIETLQEWFGYLLTGDTRQQKILAIIGPRRSGKGTIARILRSVVGPENCCGPTLGGLAQNFGLQTLLGKSVAIISDARLSGRTDQAVITERLLSISGEDALSVPRKFREDVTVKLPTRFVILTNEIPRLSDASGALTGRLIVLKLTRSFYGNEDTGLTERLLRELPGILLWSIAGWARLRNRGRFLQPESGRELVEEAERLSSPIRAFVTDRCEVNPARQVGCSELYDAFSDWAEKQGQTHVGTAAVFGRDLHAAVPTIRVRNLREGDARSRSYAGISLR